MQKPRFISAFLSHSHDDKRLVREVATELGLWGIVPWIDETGLTAGGRLGERIEGAIEDCSHFVLFMSRSSAEARWVRLELKHALRTLGRERVVAIAVDRDAPRALEDWPELGGKDQMLAIEGPGAEQITEGIAGRAYKDLPTLVEDPGLAGVPALGLHLDQRGSGEKAGPPADVPQEVALRGMPVLVFRADRGHREEYAQLSGRRWRAAAGRLERLLSGARGQHVRSAELHLFGNAQLGLSWLVGAMLNRATGAAIHAYNIRDEYNGTRSKFVTPPGGERLERRGTARHGEHPCAAPLGAAAAERVALLLGGAGYLADARDYFAGTPVHWFDLETVFDQEHAIEVVADISATVQGLRDRGARSVALVNCLPFHLTPLVAQQVAKLPVRTEYYEFRRDLADSLRGRLEPGQAYEHLPMGGEKT